MAAHLPRPELSELDGIEPIDRSSMNAFEDQARYFSEVPKLTAEVGVRHRLTMPLIVRRQHPFPPDGRRNQLNQGLARRTERLRRSAPHRRSTATP
jgi:hypothetical protein